MRFLNKSPIRLLTVVTFVAAVGNVYADKLIIKKRGEHLPPAQLGIAPPSIDSTIAVSQGERLDKSIILYNYNSKPKKIELSLVDIDKKRRPIKPNKNSLSPWTIINPKTFTIPANGQQTIRLSIRPPAGFSKKIHYAMLKIENTVNNAFNLNEESGELTLTLGSNYGMPIIIKTK